MKGAFLILLFTFIFAIMFIIFKSLVGEGAENFFELFKPFK